MLSFLVDVSICKEDNGNLIGYVTHLSGVEANGPSLTDVIESIAQKLSAKISEFVDAGLDIPWQYTPVCMGGNMCAQTKIKISVEL